MKPTKPLLADQGFTLSPKQNPPVIYPGHWKTSGIEPEGEVYIYIYKQRVRGLVVEERTMKVVVVLVLVGSLATCTTHLKHRTHTIKGSQTTALSHEQDSPAHTLTAATVIVIVSGTGAG